MSGDFWLKIRLVNNTLSGDFDGNILLVKWRKKFTSVKYNFLNKVSFIKKNVRIFFTSDDIEFLCHDILHFLYPQLFNNMTWLMNNPQVFLINNATFLRGRHNLDFKMKFYRVKYFFACYSVIFNILLVIFKVLTFEWQEVVILFKNTS